MRVDPVGAAVSNGRRLRMHASLGALFADARRFEPMVDVICVMNFALSDGIIFVVESELVVFIFLLTSAVERAFPWSQWRRKSCSAGNQFVRGLSG